jgi:hypothetical protein
MTKSMKRIFNWIFGIIFIISILTSFIILMIEFLIGGRQEMPHLMAIVFAISMCINITLAVIMWLQTKRADKRNNN